LTVRPNDEALQIRCVPAGNLTVSVPLDRLERVDFGGGKRNCCLRRLSSVFWRRWHRDAVGPSTTNGDQVSSFTLVTPYSAFDLTLPALTDAMSSPSARAFWPLDWTDTRRTWLWRRRPWRTARLAAEGDPAKWV